MNLVKVNKKYTNNKLIYLNKVTYKKFLKLANHFYKEYHYHLIITDGYKTNYIIEHNNLKTPFNTGNFFRLVIHDHNAYNFIINNIVKYGIIHENSYFYLKN